ncbi:MAG: hypothetical protein ACE5IZ_10760 [Dehalococcoidia bacterium]
MSAQEPQPMAGVFRVFFFLAVAAVTVAVVVIGVFNFYEPPGGEVFPDGEGEQADYNRNIGVILSLIGTATMAGAILGLGSRFNPLRAGLLVAGVGLLLTGVVIGANGSNDWLAFLMAALAFTTLVGSSPWLEEGLPVGGRPS